MSAPGGDARSRRAAWGTALAAVLLAVLLGEGALRLIDYSAPVWYEPDAQLGWRLRPGVAGRYRAEGEARVETNAAGWRDGAHEIDKPAGVYRIVVLGDSYAEAMQVEQAETFWARLPGLLEACGFAGGQRVEVLNFGVSGYGTAQEYRALRWRAMPYRPDLVLLQFTNGNDVRNNARELEEEVLRPFYTLDPDGSLRPDDDFAASPRFLTRASWPYALFREAADHLRLVQLLQAARQAWPPSWARATGVARAAGADGVEAGLDATILAPPGDERWRQAWRVSEALIARIEVLSRRHGARFLAITVPHAIQVHPQPAIRARLQARLGVDDLFYPDHRLRDFARGQGIDLLPLAPAMQAEAEAGARFFHGFPATGLGQGHWNAAGHRLAGELIAGHLCRSMEKNATQKTPPDR